MASGLFPHTREDDLLLFPELDLGLAIKTEP